jgi:hypothetical protein
MQETSFRPEQLEIDIKNPNIKNFSTIVHCSGSVKWQKNTDSKISIGLELEHINPSLINLAAASLEADTRS